MRQTTLSVALEVKPESADHLAGLLDALRDRRERNPSGGKGPYAEFLTRVPTVHFLSFSVFPGFDYDPLFVLEANFDGRPGPFWAQLEAAVGPDLRQILRCCKRPMDGEGRLFDAVVSDDSRFPVAPYLERRALTPTVFHHGNWGMSRDRILAEHALFLGTRQELADSKQEGRNLYRLLAPEQLHQQLRAKLIDRFVWLDLKSPRRISVGQSILDYVHLYGFAVLVLFALSLPGMLLKLQLPWKLFAAALAIALALFLGLLRQLEAKGPAPGTPVTPEATGGRTASLAPNLLRWGLPVLLFLLLYLATVTAAGSALSMLVAGREWDFAWRANLIWFGWGLISAPVCVAALLLWLRRLEQADASQSAPPVDPVLLREMARREDWIPQNHMGSVVLLKPGILRSILIRAGHQGLGLLLRVKARDGYLGSMRTIHFAHWALVNNRSRLMFFSNFDQTWESYLDDFIEKAHAGLTLAWSCGVGFPPTRYLVMDGARHGRQFKEWARHSMAVSRFWYSAYTDLTADQIERNFRIAEGLRKQKLTEKQAAAWMLDL